MDVRIGSHEIDILTVQLAGRLDAMEAGQLRQLISSHIEDGQFNLAVDLSDVEFVDSAGLAALVKGMKDARSSGGDLRLVWPNSPDARRVFQLTSFDQVFRFEDSLPDLLARW